MNSIPGYDKWLTTPPDDGPEGCEYCGEAPEQDMTGDYYCANKFCPGKFQGIEKQMAEALVDALDDVRTYKRYKVKYLDLVEGLESSGLE